MNNIKSNDKFKWLLLNLYLYDEIKLKGDKCIVPVIRKSGWSFI